MSGLIQQSEEVAAALSDGRPVVALESAIISHGLPYPQSVETARRAEEIVRKKGAVPATIGVLDGKVRVGLSEDELERFAKDPKIQKVSRRDLAVVVTGGQAGATTVAATMYCADLAGIHFQATGGIGGVHRGGESSLDISADLSELARTRVAVVCSGPKAVLDIRRTLEVLETLGVPVVGYRTSECPAFYSRTSGVGLPKPGRKGWREES